MLSKPEAHRLPVQRHQSLLRCSMMRIGSVVLLLSLVATAACGGATTHDDASLQGGGAGTLGVEASGGNVGKTSSLAPLVPLISGHLSTYAFRPLDPALPMTETCDNPRTVVGEPTVIDGQSGVMYETFCGRNPFLVVGWRPAHGCRDKRWPGSPVFRVHPLARRARRELAVGNGGALQLARGRFAHHA